MIFPKCSQDFAAAPFTSLQNKYPCYLFKRLLLQVAYQGFYILPLLLTSCSLVSRPCEAPCSSSDSNFAPPFPLPVASSPTCPNFVPLMDHHSSLEPQVKCLSIHEAFLIPPWTQRQARALPEQCHNVPCISLLDPFSHRTVIVGVLTYLPNSLWAASGQEVLRLGFVLLASAVCWMNESANWVYLRKQTLTSNSLAIHERCYGNPQE